MARIVLIEDEENLRRTLVRFLEREGHEVSHGGAFSVVQERLRPGRFDLLISDILMPEVDGLEVLREVVERRGCREPVLLITGQPSLESAAEAVRRGAFDYISKPVTKAKLLDAVARGQRQVQLLRERDEALRKQMDLLRNLAALGEQVSFVSHEIRTPITSLRHALHAIGDHLGLGDRAVVEDLIANIARIERLLNLTLSFARPLDLRVEDSDLTAIARDAVAQARRLPVVATMQVDLQGADTPVRCDRQLVGEILVNLIRNAAEACGSAGRIELRCAGTADSVQVDVADDGPGVPVNRRDEIFRPFQSFKEGGTGIGLAFSRKIAESHGGSLDLVEQERGACFRLVLPTSS